jgi:hypothetical protein
LFVSRAIKPHGLAKLRDFIDSPIVTAEIATKKMFRDLFSLLLNSLNAIENKHLALKKIDPIVKDTYSINYRLINQVT